LVQQGEERVGDDEHREGGKDLTGIGFYKDQPVDSGKQEFY
jgi:hypothetical protein